MRFHFRLSYPMLYLDVTSSCKSSMSTGVQRVVRSIHWALRARIPVEPLVWDDKLASYCRLSPRERAFLERTGTAAFASAAEPEFAANPWPWSKIQRHLTHRVRRLDLAAVWQPGDAFFAPEIFQDHRIDWCTDLPPNQSVKRVAFFHDAIVWRFPKLCPPRRHARFEEYMVALAGFDEIITNSEQSAADLREFWRLRGLDQTPPVSPHALAIDEAGGPRPSHAAPTARSVLCVSTLEARKNHLALLAAADRLWNEDLTFELELVGRTTRHWGERVTMEIDRLRDAGRTVRWQMHVDNNRLRRAYADCRFTVFPSLVEGFGLPILESLWHGKPCVCADRGAIAETASGGGCLLVDVARVDAITDAMRELLTSDEALAHYEREAAARTFPTWEDYADWLRPKLTPAVIA